MACTVSQMLRNKIMLSIIKAIYRVKLLGYFQCHLHCYIFLVMEGIL